MSEPNATTYPPTRTKLIFNPGAGVGSPVQLLDILTAMQDWNLVPEVYVIGADTQLSPVIQAALRDGIRLFVVGGGDSTIEGVAAALAGSRATLGIIATGTRNNVALSLGIPTDIPSAVALLRTGRRSRIDIGYAACGEDERPFLEVCSVGLVAAVFQSADDIQHGNLGRIGDFLTTLAAFPLIEMRIVLDKRRAVACQGHGVIIANMPFIGPNLQVADRVSPEDGRLDLLVLTDQSKLNLLGKAMQPGNGTLADPPTQRFRVRSAEIVVTSPLSLMTDGQTCSFDEGTVHVRIQRRAIRVIAGSPAEAPPAALEETPVVPMKV